MLALVTSLSQAQSAVPRPGTPRRVRRAETATGSQAHR